MNSKSLMQIAIFALGTTLLGCPVVCPDYACMNTLDVEIDRQSDAAFETGNYAFIWTRGTFDEETQVECVLEEEEGQFSLDCNDELYNTETTISENGRSITAQWVEADTEAPYLRIEHESNVLFDELLNPTWVEQFPEGEECGPYCSIATLELTID